MDLKNWVKWLQVRIPTLKEKHNEVWLKQALDGYKDDYMDENLITNPFKGTEPMVGEELKALKTAMKKQNKTITKGFKL